MLKITKQMIKDNRTNIIRYSFLTVAIVISLVVIVVFAIQSNRLTVDDKKSDNDFSGPSQFLPGE